MEILNEIADLIKNSMGRRAEPNTRRLAEVHFTPLSFIGAIESVYVQAYSQGVVGGL